ncbi:MAG: nucleoside-diphosphate sugar epimerase/dehydratase, partial [Bacillota bacterium]|nr:nucleoside-diphosphate sugar epimerase/dehydratase [Bacillota bacterium]
IILILNIIISCICFVRMPISYYAMGCILHFLLAAGMRMSYRALRILGDYFQVRTDDSLKKVLIVGAGEAGRLLVREYKNQVQATSRVMGFVDDNREKTGRSIEGVRILGRIKDVPELVKEYGIDDVIIAIPSASASERQRIIEECKTTDCELHMLPSVSQLVSGKVRLEQLKSVDINELLGRDPVEIDDEEVNSFIRGKTILVTGGGGSIGSELMRQIAARYPKRLILLDIYENNAYAIQLELRDSHPELDLVVLIGSVRDANRMKEIMDTYHPDVVYHAAAHKHVPLMEDSPGEAIKNNAMGTCITAQAASDAGVSRFVLISTDKAVNPTNIMGASKRLCEMIIQYMNERSDTEFVAVRFGNVLGSNGSVVPVFEEQIRKGGPVTVTHPEITRFFMTIPEAVSLVLQAGAFARGGEIFVLDMGKPVKIDDLARNMIYLAGHVPDVDIKIQYTGLRPGEKLYEEILMDEEGLEKTKNDLIYIGHPSIPENDFPQRLEQLVDSAQDGHGDIRTRVADIVTTYDVDAKANMRAGR